MSTTNGTRKWLVGVLTAVALGYAGWLGISAVQAQARGASHEAQLELMRESLSKLDTKLDRILRRLPDARRDH